MPSLSAQDRNIADRRLRWRCRRGMKELDVLLERYVHSYLEGEGERRSGTGEHPADLERLLALPDPVLIEYLLGHVIPDEPALARLVRLIASPTVIRNDAALPERD